MMEVCCSFKSIVGGICGSDSRDRKHKVQVVPLTSCTKDMWHHLASIDRSYIVSSGSFLSARLYGQNDHMSTSSWETWIGMDKGLCRVPAALSNHGKSSRKLWPKGDGTRGKKILK